MISDTQPSNLFPLDDSRPLFGLWLNLLLAAISGLLNILVFPVIDFSFLCWVALVPLLLGLSRQKPGWRAFLQGMVTGSIFFFGTCYWIIHVLNDYGGLGAGASVLVFLLLVLYLSLFFGLFTWLNSRVCERFPGCGAYMSPILWVATEYLRGHLLTGLPWCLMGYALVDYSNLAQVATWTGVYGLSLAVILINSLVAAVLASRTRKHLFRLVWAVAGLSGLSLLGLWQRGQLPEPQNQVRIVQTNISLEQRWDMESKIGLLDELTKLSLAGASASQHSGFLLTLWPETPTPFYFNHDPIFRQRMQQLARGSGGYFLFGFVDYRSPAGRPDHPEPYNSVAVLSPAGEMLSQYDKIHLVPFGEYIPYPRLFFFVDKISTEAGNFKPGGRVVVSSLNGQHRIGGFICYEAVVPELVRQFAKQGAEVLYNVTNDGWFGDSSAPYQHLSMARMRAIENRRYLLRAANNGISAVIDPWGRVVCRTRLNERTLLEGGFDFASGQTFYTHYGDIFVWLCVLTSAFLAIRIFLPRRS